MKSLKQSLNTPRFEEVQHHRTISLVASFLVLLMLTLGLFQLYRAEAQSNGLSFGSGLAIQMIDPAGLNIVPFWNYNDTAVNFELYTLPPERFVENYQRLERYSSTQTWDATGLTLQHSWTLTNTRDTSSYYDEMWTVPLPEGTESDIYIIKASDGQSEDASSMIVVGQSVLTLKQGNNGQVVVWAATLQSGAPVAGMDVKLYDIENGQQVAQGITDEKGVVELNSGDAAHVMAIGQLEDETGRQVALAGTDDQWRNYRGNYWGYNQSQEDYRIYLYTDRSIYRPGHTIYFDTIVRNNTQAGYSVIDASTPMTATLRDPRNTIVDTVTLQSDDFGTANSQFVLGDEPPLGTYHVELEIDGQTQRQALQVQEYRKPEYEVEVSTGERFAIMGDPISVTVDANYFFGQPVADAAVTLKISRRPLYRYWWWWIEDDSYYPYWSRSGVLETKTGRTDAEGRWTVAFDPSSYTEEQDYGAIYSFEAEVTDAQELPIQGQSTVRVYRHDVDLEVSTGKYGYRTDEPVTLNLSAQKHDDTPVAGQIINVRLESSYYDREDENNSIINREATTDGAGQATLTLEDIPQGWYRILATTTDGRGRTVEVRRYLWVYDPEGRDWWFTSGDEISIMLDKESYAPGDTAQLLIQSRVAGIGLLTLEREGVHEELIVNVAEGMTTVEVPITEAFAPNIFARIHLFKPRTPTRYSRHNEGDLISAQVELTIPANDKRTTVEISTDAEKYLPGQEAEVTIQLKDAQGQPVTGRVTLALVDEAIFALQADLSADLFDTFYGAGQNRVAIYDSLARRPYDYGGIAELSADDNASFGGEEDAASPPAPAEPTRTPLGETEDEGSQPRTNFQDTAHWEPGVIVEGTATVRVPLPDNLTTWRIIVKAVTAETTVGEGTANLLVTKEIISRPTMPRFTVLGDLFDLSLVSQNFSGQAVAGTASVETDHLVLLNEPSTQLNLADKGTDVARWTAVASHIGTGPITTTLDTSAGKDIVGLPLLTKPFAIPERWSASGQANPTVTETFTMPLNAVNEASNLTVRLSPSIALGVLEGLDDLIAYPYGCVEQTMSRVLPSAVAAQAYKDLGIPNPKAEELPSILNKGLQKLYGYQQQDGGWGWFYDDSSGIYLTSYVLLGLTRIQAAGFEVDQSVLDKGFVALDNALSRGTDQSQGRFRQDERNSDDIRAFALYVKALADKGDAQAALTLANKPLGADAMGLLALALEHDGETAQAQALMDRLISQATQLGDTAFWPLPDDEWEWYHWRTMASTDKNTAVAVLALSKLRPNSELLPQAVRWLMDHRRGSSWRNTQATAFAVLGLLDYIKASGELESNYTYAVSLNGNEVATGQVTPENVTQPIEPIVIPGIDLKMGDNEVTISRVGEVSAASLEQQNPLYYNLLLKQQLFYDGYSDASSVDAGLKLSRSYELAEGEPRDDGHYNVGDVVEVKLTLEVRDETWYLMVQDPIPAGFEALNERMNAVSYCYDFCWSRWYEWGYNRKDVRDDSVDFFITHGWPGEHTLSYKMRATTAGTFSVLPGQAYPMYAEEIWGRSASAQISVKPERLAQRPLLLGDADNNCRLDHFDTLQVIGAWGTVNADRDLAANDGVIRLADIAAVARQQGSDCVTPVETDEPERLAEILVVLPQQEIAEGEEVEVQIMAAGDVDGIELNLDLAESNAELADVNLNSNLSDEMIALGPQVDEASGDVVLGAVEVTDDDADGGQVQASMTEHHDMMTVVLRGTADGTLALDVNQVQAMDSRGQLMTTTVRIVAPTQVEHDYFFLPLIRSASGVPIARDEPANDNSTDPAELGDSSDATTDEPSDDSSTTDGEVSAQDAMDQLVAGNSEFALDLYRTLSAEKDGNLIFSPYSVSSALAMIYAGARGETESQMAETLNYTLSQELLHPTFKALDLALMPPASDVAESNEAEANETETNEADSDDAFRLSIVNGVWAHDGYPFLQEYLDLITENYRAEIKSVNFEDPAQREAARLAINAWVEEATEDRIVELIKEGILTANTRMALINAIYFNAKWEDPFLNGTSDSDFTLLDGTQVSVPTMSRRWDTKYAQNGEYEMLEIPYKDSTMSMVILMPSNGTFAAVEESLTEVSVTQSLNALTTEDVKLYLPKFQSVTDLRLNQTMKNMGMADLFMAQGDLSGMDGKQNLFLAHLIHKSFIAVDELGTEAAASTGGIPEILSDGLEIHVNRPFIYLIRDSETGSILFMGRILDPSR